MEPWIVGVELDDNPIKFKIDTGADVTVINIETYKKLKRKPRLQQSDKRLSSPGGPISIKGMFDARIIFKA